MLFDKLIAKRVAAAESEILKKHYAEVEAGETEGAAGGCEIYGAGDVQAGRRQT